MSRSIIKNTSLYVLGNLFNKAIAFITIPIFTRILSAEEFGIVNTYVSWVSLIAVIIGLSLGNSIRNAFVDKRKELGEYISSIFILSSINFIIICIIYYFLSKKINIEPMIVWFCLIESFFNFIINSIIIKYMMEEKAIKRTIMLIAPNLIGAILSIILIQLMVDEKYYGRIIATCISTCIFGLFILLYYVIKYKVFFNNDYWKYGLAISIPLIFHGLSCNILGTSDRTIIIYYCGANETGIYSFIYNLGMLASVAVASAEGVWIPRFTKAMIEKKYAKINKEAKYYIFILLGIFCSILLIAPELITYLGGEVYLSGRNMIYPIIISSFIIFLYGIYVNIEFYYKDTKMIAISTCISAIINLILNIIFVPKFGAIAAAYTTLFSYVFSFILHRFNAKKLNKNLMIDKSIILAVIIIVVISFIASIFSNSFFIRWGLVIILFIMFCKFILKVKKEL